MTLTERDKNQKVSNSSNGKRKKVEIDLTNDDTDTEDQQPASKVAKNGGQRSDASSQQFRYPCALPTPPLSSAPHSSQSQSIGQRAGRYDSFYSSTSSQTLADTQHTQAERESWLVDDDEDYSETVASTQTAAGDTEQLTLYGTLSTKIVGVQYYRGNANPGEQILMRREPGNPYDKNAIRIDNVATTQIGHIPRKVAEKLAKFMDSGRLHTEGELAGYIGQFDCPLSVHMYGPEPQSGNGQRLIADMKADKLPVKAVEQAEKQREKEQKEEEKRKQQEEKSRLAEARKAAAAGGTSNGRVPVQANQYGYANQSQAGLNSTPVMSDILEAAQRFNPREIGRATDEYGMKEEALKSMPMAEKPKGIRTTMLPYQLQALKWMLDQESPQLPPKGSKDAVQLWKLNDCNPNLFTNLATTFSTESPQLASGGILADDMGLGKTLEVISLIIADKDKAGNNTQGPTLLIAPLSVMSNWTTQITQHVKMSRELSIYVYHGSGRVQMKKADFEEYDVIITTYGTLSSDYAPKGKVSSNNNKQADRQLRSTGLFSVPWRRIVLDEGHQIRNPASKMASAATALTAQSRWVLTGTPIVNTLKDLYCLLRFLGVSGGLETLEIFTRVLVRPLKQGEASATFLLQAVMAAFTLRRRKDMAFIDLRLPKLDEYVHRVEFTAKERERYDVLTAEAQGLLKRYENKAGQQEKGAGEAFQNLLEILLRMRQCCNHWQMCGERITNLLAKLEEQKTVDLTPENKEALQDMLQIHLENQEDCPICMETLYDHDPVVTICGHSFCRLCISTAIEGQKKCPMCRAQLENAERTLVGPANETCDKAANDNDDLDLTQSSTKLESMMEILAASKTNKDKTVIFSQWTRFLDIVESRLIGEGYKFCRIDGTRNAQKRDAALQALDSDPDCTIMLASLSVCAVGLNLTAANQAILSDTWWSPAIEDQAVDRVHRLGQRRETRVFRLVMENSVEEHTIKIQDEKRKLMQLAFSEKEGKRQKAKTGRLADIQRLLRGSGKGGE